MNKMKILPSSKASLINVSIIIQQGFNNIQEP